MTTVSATLTPEQATATAFPPGCPVLFPRPVSVASLRASSTSYSSSSSAASSSDLLPPRAIPKDTNSSLVAGVVESVSLDVSPGTAERRRDVFVYEIRALGNGEEAGALLERASEGSLRYAPRCPVLVRDSSGVICNSGKNGERQQRGTAWLEGTVTSGYDVPHFGDSSVAGTSASAAAVTGGVAGAGEGIGSGSDDRGTTRRYYSAEVTLPNGLGRRIVHGIPTDGIKFLPPGLEPDTVQQQQQQQESMPMGKVGDVTGAAGSLTFNHNDETMDRADGGGSAGGRGRDFSAISNSSSDDDDAYKTLSYNRGDEKRRRHSCHPPAEKSPVKRARRTITLEEEDLSFCSSEAALRKNSSPVGRLLNGDGIGPGVAEVGAAGDFLESRTVTPERYAVHTLDVPSWLSTVSVKGHIVGEGGRRHKVLEQRSKCRITLIGKGSGRSRPKPGEPTEYMQVVIRDPSRTNDRAVALIKNEIEEILLSCIGSNNSLGRFLYEMKAAEKREGSRRNCSVGPVLQRDHTSAKKKVWMDIVNLPVDDENNAHGRFLIGVGGKVNSAMCKKHGCSIRVMFDDDTLLCDPYVFIYSEERMAVINAKREVLSRIRDHQESCMKRCSLR